MVMNGCSWFDVPKTTLDAGAKNAAIIERRHIGVDGAPAARRQRRRVELRLPGPHAGGVSLGHDTRTRFADDRAGIVQDAHDD